MSSAPAVAVDLDGALGDTGPLWRAFLEDAARRYAAIAPLEPGALPEDRGAAATALDVWAEAGVGDWRAALERFAEDHAPVHLRQRADASAALRVLVAAGARIGVWTDAPEELARVALAQLGAARRIEALETGAGSRQRLRDRLGADAREARTAEELSALAAAV